MNYETLNHHWFTANAMARRAENRIFRAIEASRKGEGNPPTAQEVAAARQLRQVASDFLEAAMKAIWRKPT
jgi:hypothetical protein